jgi:hypothetical protein
MKYRTFTESFYREDIAPNNIGSGKIELFDKLLAPADSKPRVSVERKNGLHSRRRLAAPRLPVGPVRLRGDCPGPHSASHEKAAIGWRNPIRWTTVGGRIMKMMTREQLFTAPRLARRAKARFNRGMEAVSAARARAMEIAQQCAALPRLTPNVSHRRRMARLRSAQS